MKIILMGNNIAAIKVLKYLLNQKLQPIDIMVIVPFGKKIHDWHESLYDFAKKRNIKSIYDPENVNHPYFLEEIRKFEPDYIFSIYYDQIFREELISIPRYGAINAHPSLLPKYKGVAPLIWAIINNEEETGVTFHYIDNNIDTGLILLQEKIQINHNDTGYSLHKKAAKKVEEMFIKLFPQLINQTAPKPIKQRGVESYYSKKMQSKNCINWNNTTEQIHNIIRALTKPLPCAFTFFKDGRLLLLESSIPNFTPRASFSLKPGEFTEVNNQLFAKTSNGWLKLKKIHYMGIDVSGKEFIKKISRQGFFSDHNQEERMRNHTNIKNAKKMILFGEPNIGEDEIKEVTQTLRSGWIGMGEKVKIFEKNFASYTGAKHAIAVNSCTSALHLSLIALNIKNGDEIITTPLTFVATVNAIMYTGARPVFADIDPTTLNISHTEILRKITPKTKAIMPVHFGGLPCNMREIKRIAKKHDLAIIEDAAHAVGAVYNRKKIGDCNNLTCFSFYPNKNITSAEGGMITTNDKKLAHRLNILRLHGLHTDAWKRFRSKELITSDMYELGYKYNMTDIQASIGIHQLNRIEEFMRIRERYARIYDEIFNNIKGIRLQFRPNEILKNRHALHLYVVVINPDYFTISRDALIMMLREKNIGAAFHYKPIHLHPFYHNNLKYKIGNFPISEFISDHILTLPLTPKMTLYDVKYTAEQVKYILNKYRKK